MVAARLLASCVGPDDAWLGRVAEGTALVTLAVRPAASGTATLVPGAAVADAALVLDADTGELVLVPLRADGRRSRTSASSPLADVATTAADRVVLASGQTTAAPRSTGRSTSGARSPPAGSAASSRAALGTRRRSTPRTASSSACRSARSRPCSTSSPTWPPTSTAPSCSPPRRCGRSTSDEAVADRFASMAFWFAAQTAEQRRVGRAALPRRLRLHGGVRHPALLPACQGHPAAARRSPRASCSSWPTGCSPTAPRPPPPKLDGARLRRRCRPSHERRGPDFRLGPDVEAFRDEVRCVPAPSTSPTR